MFVMIFYINSIIYRNDELNSFGFAENNHCYQSFIFDIETIFFSIY